MPLLPMKTRAFFSTFNLAVNRLLHKRRQHQRPFMLGGSVVFRLKPFTGRIRFAELTDVGVLAGHGAAPATRILGSDFYCHWGIHAELRECGENRTACTAGCPRPFGRRR